MIERLVNFYVYSNSLICYKMRIAQRRGKCRINSDNKDLYFYVKSGQTGFYLIWLVSVAMFNFFFSLSVWIDTGTYIGNSAVLGK